MNMNTGDAAWVLVSSAMVLFMTPGLAFFYGGMDRSRNVLNMLMMNFWCLLIIPILWVVVGYSIAGGNFDAAFFGGFGAAFLKGIGLEGEGAKQLLTIAFLGMFAVITPRTDLRRGRRPHEVHGLGHLRPGLDAPGVRTGLQVGLRRHGPQ